MGFFIEKKLYYFTSSVGTCTESTDTFVESTTTAVESVDTSVDVPVPQDANATIANNATIFFMFVFFC
jgi:hypothetical protein